MTVTAANLADRVGTTDAAKVEDDLTRAQGFYADAVAGAFRPIPEHVADECVLSIGQALYERRRKSSSGAGLPTTMDGAIPVRAPRDPLASVRPILANYVAGMA